MITIKHMPSDWETMPDVSWSVEDDAAIAANHPCYFTGYDMPNYPMPAIPTEVLIGFEWCAIFEWHGPEKNGATLRVVLEVERYQYQG